MGFRALPARTPSCLTPPSAARTRAADGGSLVSRLLCGLVLPLLLLLTPLSGAATPVTIALVIDDIGDSLADGRRVIALPAPVACAVLPHTPYGDTLAREAHAAGKEVLLHLPMEPVGESETGPGRIETGMPSLELSITLDHDLASVPYAVGVNNHMGSRLTRDRDAMRRVMRGIRRHGNLYFIDSLTTPASVAAQVAREEGVPAMARQVFLDDDPRPEAVDAQFDQLLQLARRHGAALAIGHPRPETLAVLERRLPHLAALNVQVVAPSVMLNAPSVKESPWPPSSSPSPKAPKSSKP
jgi:uncharacterized protein